MHCRNHTLTVPAVALLVGICMVAPAFCAEPIDMGNRLELFVDDYLVANVTGEAARTLLRPEPGEVVFVADAPWEGNTSGYYTFFQDGKTYKMIYRGWQHDRKKKQARPAVTCYAESTDGVNWTRPDLGLHPWAGSKKNNIIWMNAPESHNLTPFRDDNPAAPAGARYKAVGGHQRGRLYGLVSPDCKSWKRIRRAPVLTNGYFDSQNLAFWDADRGEYRAYWRYFHKGVRAIRTATSRDFLTWKNEADLTYTKGTPREHLYTNAIQKYFRAPHLFIGFPTRYDPKSQQVEPIFMTSRNGQTFHRHAQAVIPRTAPKNRNHNRSNYMAWGMFQLPGKPREISVYATENYYEPTPGRVRRFVYRVDGFVALRAGAKGATVLTRPLRYRGSELTVNYAVRKGGSLRIDVLNETGNIIGTSKQLTGDRVDAEVDWQRNPALKQGVVQLRFTMTNADVYSLRFHKPRANAMKGATVPGFSSSSSCLAADTPPLAKAPFNTDQAKEFQQQWARHIGKRVVQTNSIGMKMVLIPPGEFTMGRSEEQFDKVLQLAGKAGQDPARLAVWEMLMMPPHPVRITKPFYMGATEVTVGQFRQFCKASGYKTEAERGLHGGRPYKGHRTICTWRKPMVWIKLKQKDDEPVLHLCWNDCVEFCKWLSKKEGVAYCLPTEAQWEYACRAGTATAWSFGNFEDFDRLAHEYTFVSDGRQGKHDRPSRVGIRKPNAFGLYDMHGNVWEYVADWWHRFTYKNSPVNDPTGPAVQSEKGDMRRIIRAGSFDWGRWGAQSVYRMRITQRSTQHPHQGFRVAMRVKGVKGVLAAIDPDEQRRRKKRDPGVNSPKVVAALKAGATEKKYPNDLAIDLGKGVKMEFVLIRPGTFLMGSRKGPADERPVHRVVISKPFYMARHEVTQSQWEAVMGKHKWLTDLTKGDNEMTGPAKAMNVLSWNDCQRLIRRLKGLNGESPGHAFALPTEAQWEYACRAGSTSEFHFGDDESQLGRYAWFQGNMNWPGQPGFRGKAFYHDVGRKTPNKWGLYDMHGGVWEWCADGYDRDYYLNAPLVDPKGPQSARFRVLRGGSWFRYAKYARSAYRRFFHPDGDGDGVTAWINDFGCRLVINLDDAGATTRSGDKPQRAANYTKLARSLVRYRGNPVIKVGKKGAWNDQTLGCFTVLDDGDTFYFYSGGARFGKKKNIGMATSRDGVNWAWYEKNPLFGGSMPYVIKVGDTFRLYHPGGHAGLSGLQMRTSGDGFNWSKPMKVMGPVADPCVVRVAENKFHLYFCSGGRKAENGKQVWEFKNYMAVSEDGIRWKKEPKSLLPLGAKGSWDAQSHAGPCVLKLADGFHMWYLGSGTWKGKTAWRIGHATSPDGLNWTRSGTAPVLDIGRPGGWDGGTFMSFDIIFRDGKFLFWYAAAPTGHGDETKMTIQIGHGTSE